jgi:hypothetical protein
MYWEKFVASLKCDDKFLKDNNGIVELPFNSQYNIYLKNLNSQDAVVGVSVDGEDVLDNQRLVVNANSNIELLGFLEGNKVKNRFKFLEFTKDIEDKVGYSPELSIIRVEVWFRKPKPVVQEYVTKHNWEWTGYPTYPYIYPRYDSVEIYCGDVIYGDRMVWGGGSVSSNGTVSKSVSPIYSVQNCSLNSSNNDLGITVKGDDCNQNFSYTSVNDLEEQSHVIILKLKGFKDDSLKVAEVIGARDKITCSECGQSNSVNNMYCPKCGKLLK